MTDKVEVERDMLEHVIRLLSRDGQIWDIEQDQRVALSLKDIERRQDAREQMIDDLRSVVDRERYMASWVETARSREHETVARMSTITEDAIAHTREYYDEAIFPPRPPGRHSEVYDAEAAAVARLTCDSSLRVFRKRVEDYMEERE